jgi:hypothetical protein
MNGSLGGVVPPWPEARMGAKNFFFASLTSDAGLTKPMEAPIVRII